MLSALTTINKFNSPQSVNESEVVMMRIIANATPFFNQLSSTFDRYIQRYASLDNSYYDADGVFHPPNPNDREKWAEGAFSDLQHTYRQLLLDLVAFKLMGGLSISTSANLNPVIAAMKSAIEDFVDANPGKTSQELADIFMGKATLVYRNSVAAYSTFNAVNMSAVSSSVSISKQADGTYRQSTADTATTYAYALPSPAVLGLRVVLGGSATMQLDCVGQSEDFKVSLVGAFDLYLDGKTWFNGDQVAVIPDSIVNISETVRGFLELLESIGVTTIISKDDLPGY